MQEKFGYTPDQEEAIADIFAEPDAKGDERAIVGIIIDRMRNEFGVIDLAGIEKIFRAKKFKTYLVAVPLKKALLARGFIDTEVVCKLPGDEEGIEKSYVLSLFPQGIKQVMENARKYGFSYDATSNVANLRDTGFMTPRDGSQMSQASIYQLN